MVIFHFAGLNGVSTGIIVAVSLVVVLLVMGHITGMLIVILYLVIRKKPEIDIYAQNKDLLEVPTIQITSEKDTKIRKKKSKKKKSKKTKSKKKKRSSEASYTSARSYIDSYARNRTSMASERSSYSTAWPL